MSEAVEALREAVSKVAVNLRRENYSAPVLAAEALEKILAESDGLEWPERDLLAQGFTHSFFRATALMNDTFAYACADGEEFTCDSEPIDLEAAMRLWIDHGHVGLMAAAAVNRGEEPIKPHRTERYMEAREAAGREAEREES